MKPESMTLTLLPQTQEDRAANVARVEVVERTHQCPPNGGSGLMPCCGRTPFEVPRTDRMTVDGVVTCNRG